MTDEEKEIADKLLNECPFIFNTNQDENCGDQYFGYPSILKAMELYHSKMTQLDASNSFSKQRKQHKKSLELLDKYFKETPKEEIQKTMDEINEMEFDGHTVEEYFDSFGNYDPWIKIDEETEFPLGEEIIMCNALNKMTSTGKVHKSPHSDPSFHDHNGKIYFPISGFTHYKVIELPK